MQVTGGDGVRIAFETDWSVRAPFQHGCVQRC
ncbi:hypothetical protein Save01_04031 [Streptomyces avermitilis]